MSAVHVIDHPMIQHKLTIMRKKETGSKDFRELLKEISLLMGYEITRDLPLDDIEIETPICKMTAKKVSGRKLAIVPILRAGIGMVDGLQTLVPVAKVGHIGLYRDEKTHTPVVYYCKLPEDINKRLVIVTDPMLATGGSSCDALTMLKERGCSNIRLMCLVAAPEGIARVQKEHPDVDIFVAAIDECLNQDAYIIPGLGDAGDRIFGTKQKGHCMSRQIPEINYLMSLVEKRFCKSVMTSTDFYSLAQEIESETHERISASTLKRMWGYVNMTRFLGRQHLMYWPNISAQQTIRHSVKALRILRRSSQDSSRPTSSTPATWRRTPELRSVGIPIARSHSSTWATTCMK